MFTGYTGIASNGVSVDVVGDNLANLNTTAFKGQRTLFESLLYRTVREGEGPGATSGGTLPEQIGSGSQVSTVQRDFRQGGLESTGFPMDLAIDGEGFFVLTVPDGSQAFTRDGSFRLDETQTMVSAGGAPVQAFTANDDGTINVGSLADLVVPLGTTGQAAATANVQLDGRLDPTTNISSAAAVIASSPLMVSGGGTATTSTALTDLVDANQTPLFAEGDELLIRTTKGGLNMPETAFVVGTTGNTVGDLAAQLEAVLGINTDPALGGTPGVRISAGPDPPAGSLVIESNKGKIHAVELDSASIVNSTGLATAPFSFERLADPVGDGVTTSFTVYDSLGNPVDVRLRAVLESKSETGVTWRFVAESAGDTDLSPALSTGTVTFDPNGRFIGATGTDITIDRTEAGSSTPLNFTLDFSGLTGLASAERGSELVMDSQDGTPAGILTNFSIDLDGIVTAVYSNQQEEVLGQVALATFVNDEGLIAKSNNTFASGPNTGAPQIIAPQSGTAGSINAGALEQGNVEIAREFITLISASTGISASSRVVRAADDLLQELLLLAR
jgi:flagellar hook protein FlgE